MSAVDAVVFRGFMQTILITRGVPPKGGHFRPAGGGEVRAALTSHLAEDAGAVMDLATFWVDSGGRPVSVLLQAELIAEVAAAVAAGRLWAFVFREPAYVSAADHQALVKAAELAARAGPGLHSGNAYGLLPPEMGVADKFSSVFHRAAPLVGPELRAQLLAVVEDPANLAIALATLVILAQLHAVAAGEAIDAVVLSAIVACAVLRGVGLFQAISAALDAVIHLVAFIIQTAAAKEEKDLDEAATRLAAGLSSIGVSALMLALSWISARFSDSLKKTGGKKGVGKVSKEEMAGKGAAAGQTGPAEETSPSPETRRPRTFQDEPRLPSKAKETTSEFKAKRPGGVDMANLSASDGKIAAKLRAAGYSPDKVEEVLNSGRDFRFADARKGDEMYGFSSKDYPKDASSPYWLDKETFTALKDGYYDPKTGKWDSSGIKRQLALPCYNRADAVYQGQLTSDQSIVVSTINPATETVTYVGHDGIELTKFSRAMTGGGAQFTPAKGSVSNIGELTGQ